MSSDDQLHQVLHIPRANEISADNGNLTLNVGAGDSFVFVGANGSGKTRLAATIEDGLKRTHRIPAQRSIQMRDHVNVRDYKVALNELHYGNADNLSNRRGYRWHNDPFTSPIDDFERLLTALFAEQNNALVKDYRNRLEGEHPPLPETKLRKLDKLWSELLPHRRLVLEDASIKVQSTAASGDADFVEQGYAASKMSDGERAIFYLIGQCMLAPDDGVVIVDEPELHLHQSLSSRLWDAIEAERKDCAFVYVTHDVDFAVDRVAAQKFFVRSIHQNSRWNVEEVPSNTGLPEQVVIELVGNRRPVLFVEGEAGSLDGLVYGSFYTNMKIEPIGTCESVIHAVASFKKNPTLHRLGTVHGIIDADHRDDQTINQLSDRGIKCLCVAEIENIFLVPSVFIEMARLLSFDEDTATSKLNELKRDILHKGKSEIDSITARYIARRLDRALKQVTVSRSDTRSLQSSFDDELAQINIASWIADIKLQIESTINREDYEGLLRLYDVKGLLGLAAKQLGISGSKQLISLVSRTLHVGDSKLRSALQNVLPSFS